MHRVLFFKGEPYEIYSYGFMLVVAMVLGVGYMVRRAPRFGMTRDQVLDFALAVLLGGMIGARLFSVYCDWDIYARLPFVQLFNIRAGGLAWHGGVAGAIAGLFVYQWRSGIAWGKLLDLFVPAGVLGHIFGRIGCFLNGCCVGRETTVPWGVTFPDAPEWHNLTRHPSPLYEAAAETAILLFMVAYWEKRKHPDGTLLFLYFVLYGTVRFFLEFIREEPLLAGGLDIAQYISIGMVVIGALALALLNRVRPRAAEAWSAVGETIGEPLNA